MACEEPQPRPEKESCRTCPNRERCHGKKPEVTRETLLRLIHDTVLEVLSERPGR